MKYYQFLFIKLSCYLILIRITSLTEICIKLKYDSRLMTSCIRAKLFQDILSGDSGN